MKKLNSEFYNQMAVTAVSFALVVILSSLWIFIENGIESAISTVFFPEILGLLIVLQVIDYLLRTRIEKLWLYRILSFAVCCAIVEGAGIMFIWFRPSIKNILVCVLFCFIISSLTYHFWVNKYKADSDHINKQLEKEQD